MMMKAGYSIYLTDRVKELLDEGTLDEVLNLVRADLEREWVSTAPSDVSTRESTYHELHALSRVEIRLKSIISDLIFSREQN